MRDSEFWGLVDGEFGVGRGRMLVRDHVLRVLNGRTGEQAMAAGVDARTVWFALCDDFDVPPDRRWGQDSAPRTSAPRTSAPRTSAPRTSAPRPSSRRGKR